jgi:tRNA(Ile)-lysidine synthase TilS/MesJ
MLNEEFPTGDAGRHRLEQLANKIRAAGRGKKYDVVVGVSGGADSSYLLVLAKELGLRPLAAHFDNTWNSHIAVENIQRVLHGLGVDLFTQIIDNREQCDLMRAFMTASVPDIDASTDIGLATTHYLAAAKYGIRYIFDGHSFRTEGISPQGWFYMDGRYIREVHRLFGRVPLKTFPNLTMRRQLWWAVVRRVKRIRPLYYIDYDKEKAKQLLADRFGWKWYGGHHMENRTAYFTNNYYLPRKFNIDLRYCEYSALVRSGQLTRDEAIDHIQHPKPFDAAILAEVKKRLELTDMEFEALMARPGKSYRDYPTSKRTFERMRWLFWILQRFELVPRSFYLKYTRSYD